MTTENNESQKESAASGSPAANPAGKKAAAEKAAATTPAATKPAAAPSKPPAKPAAKGKGQERRNFFLTMAGAAWTTFTLATTAATLATLRFMFPNVLAEPPSQFKVGPLDPLAADVGNVNEKWKNEFNTWIINLETEKRLIALSTTCTHLGCTPSWLEAEKKFKCPCHGSGFYKNGINFEGPAPRPLERFGISLVDGVVVVDKSKIFQYELGKWNDPESFISLG